MAITSKPTKTVSNLGAPTRGSNNRTMTAKWKVPAAMTKSSSTSAATELVLEWKFAMSDKTRSLKKSLRVNTTTSAVNLNNLKIGRTTFTRSSFYPNNDRLLTSVTVSVAGKNSKGTGKAATQTRKFNTPRNPVIDEISFNTETGICSTTITTDAGADYRERYDTRYRVTVENTHTGETIISSDSSSTSTEFAVTYDASGYQNLDPEKGEYIHIKVEAWARGYAGDSATVERNFYVAYPARTTIEDVSVTAKDSTGRLTAHIATNESTEHPVDSVTIQYLADVTYENASDIPANAEWEDSEVLDNGECTALTIPVTDLIPERGKYTWIRVKSVHAHPDVLYRYSEYKRIDDVFTPAAEATAATVDIISAAAASGESAVVLLGWNADGSDEFTGTELSWSEDEDTWRSTEEPDTHDFTWSDGRYPATGTLRYNDSAEIIIKGLKEGTTYYIKARRYLDGDTTVYGAYSDTATVLTTEKPQGVVATSKSAIPAGEPLEVYWTFSGNGLQTNWAVRDINGTNIVEGTGSYGATQISAERLADLAENNSVTFNVWVSTGSGEAESEYHTVKIIQKPTLTVSAPATLTAQPLAFTASSSRPCDLIVIVMSQGASGQFPDGFKVQVAGDTIHSDVYEPIWSNGAATVTLPGGLDFWDLGNYTISVVARDRETGLQTDPVLSSFDVEWIAQAVDPTNAVSLMPLDYVTEGEHVQAVQIKLTPPIGSDATDVYDIYRMDGDTAHLIGEGFPLTYTAIDEYAPFGEAYYRIALRTVDGDIEFTEKEYELISETVRVDWQGGTLELPYGVTISDSYRKDVEFRQHLDGSTDGYWNTNINRKGSYGSAIIELVQPDEINLARALGRYPGAVFVRTQNGSAYAADVQITDISVKNEAVTLLEIEATEVGLTDEFMLPSPFELEE